jgi:hypothetical protein
MTHPNHHGFADMEIGSQVQVWFDRNINLWVVTKHDSEGNQVDEADHDAHKKSAIRWAESIFKTEPRWSQLIVETKDGIKTLRLLRGVNLVEGAA